MANIIKRLFSKNENQSPFPKISFGFRLEGIEYETENNSLFIESTRIDGRRIFTDSINKWKNGGAITNFEKEEIFGQIVLFINKKGHTKPIIVVNVDYDKTFWGELCDKYKDQIAKIEHDSNEQKENFQFNSLLRAVQTNGTLIFGDKTIKTEAELIEYWKTRNVD